MLSLDQNIFQKGATVRSRMIEYGTLVDQLHIVVATSPGLSPEKLSENVWVYPTNTSWKLFYFISAFKICKGILENFKTASVRTVVSSQEGFTNFLALVLSIFYKFGLEVQIHVDIFSPYFRRESFKNRIRVLGYWLGVKRATGIRVTVGRIKKSLVVKWSIQSHRIKILPVFVDKTVFVGARSSSMLHDKFPEFEHIILMASRITREKNYPLAMEVFSLVRNRLPSTGLVVVGEGPERANLVADYLVVLPWTNDLVPYYASADIFLLTSDYEGYGRTLIEAALVGTPIVTTDVGLVGESVNGHNALIAPSRNAQKLAQHILFLLKNKEARVMMSDRLRKVGELLPSKEEYLKAYKFFWEKSAR